MKNNLDEMQEQKLLHIEHNMAWLAFGGLVIAILGQLLVMGIEAIYYLLGEILVFMTLCIYLVTDCIRNGIWDRKLKPTDKKANFKLSLLFSAPFSFVFAIAIYRSSGSLWTALGFFAGMLTAMLILIHLAISLAVKLYNKRVTQLEEEGQ